MDKKKENQEEAWINLNLLFTGSYVWDVIPV